MSANASAGIVLPAVFTGAERVFHMAPTELAADGATTTTMMTGPWMLDRAGVPVRGGLGVLIDVGVGSAVLAARPEPDSWGVTTEISVDFCTGPPADGSRVMATARPVQIGRRGGLGAGELRSEDGQLIAIGSQRQRYLARATPPPATPGPARPPGGSTLPDLLGLEFRDHSALRLPGCPELGNVSGVLHGGVVLCCAEVAATSAVGQPGFTTSSVRVTYLRPVRLVGDIRFVPQVLNLSRSVATVQVRVTRPDGKLAAIATVVRESAGGVPN